MMTSILKALVPNDGLQNESVNIVAVSRSGRLTRVTFKYCPGCGARIGPEIKEYATGYDPTGG